MTIEERYRQLLEQKHQEELERQKYLGAAQSAAAQVEANIEKLRGMVDRIDDEKIKGMFSELVQFCDTSRLMDKAYAAALFKKSKEVEAAIEKFADELVGGN